MDETDFSWRAEGEVGRGSDFKLIMARDDWQYQAKHFPGSVRFSAVPGSQMSKLVHAGGRAQNVLVCVFSNWEGRLGRCPALDLGIFTNVYMIYGQTPT